jgi:hypothetical protein
MNIQNENIKEANFQNENISKTFDNEINKKISGINIKIDEKQKF